MRRPGRSRRTADPGAPRGQSLARQGRHRRRPAAPARTARRSGARPCRPEPEQQRRAWAARSAPARASSRTDRWRGPTGPSRPPGGPGGRRPRQRAPRPGLERPDRLGQRHADLARQYGDPLHHVAVVRDAVLARAPARRGYSRSPWISTPDEPSAGSVAFRYATIRSMIALKLTSGPKASMRSAPWKCGVCARALHAAKLACEAQPESTPVRISIITARP